MTGDSLRRATLRAASLLAPGDQRADWLEGWQSELWYVPRCEATRFCLGAFADAFWLRRNNPSPVTRSLPHPQSPVACLLLLAALAVATSVLAIHVPGPPRGPWPSRLRVSDLPGGCVGMLMLAVMLLPVLRFVRGGPPAERRSIPWRGRIRLGVFLALKIALMQPTLASGTFILMSIHTPLAPMALWALWILPCRWILIDQWRRCPICLRLLADPIRIGAASQTLLEWYGAESMCARGHGMMQTPEHSASYSTAPQWLRLDSNLTGQRP